MRTYLHQSLSKLGGSDYALYERCLWVYVFSRIPVNVGRFGMGAE